MVSLLTPGLGREELSFPIHPSDLNTARNGWKDLSQSLPVHPSILQEGVTRYSSRVRVSQSPLVHPMCQKVEYVTDPPERGEVVPPQSPPDYFLVLYKGLWSLLLR